MTYIPTPIKSIQQVSLAVAGTEGTFTLPTAVNTSASIILFQGCYSQDASGFITFDAFAWAWMSDATTVTVTKQGTGALGGAVVWSGVVVEFLQTFVKSSGQGVITVPDGSSTAVVTIPAVNTAKTIVTTTGWDNGIDTYGAGLMKDVCGSVLLVNSTSITANRYTTGAAGSNLRVGYNYLEFR